jgi:hypothetical protein
MRETRKGRTDGTYEIGGFGFAIGVCAWNVGYDGHVCPYRSLVSLSWLEMCE